MAKSQKTIPTQLEFVDIAGLVRGASKGEGLGNQFLANIREVDAIVHVLRCFENDDITHVDGGIDPLRDAETVETELMLADLESLEKRSFPCRKRRNPGKRTQGAGRSDGTGVDRPARGQARPTARPTDADGRAPSTVCNSSPASRCFTSATSRGRRGGGQRSLRPGGGQGEAEGAAHVIVSAAIEAELSQLPDDERTEFLADLGLAEAGLTPSSAPDTGFWG